VIVGAHGGELLVGAVVLARLLLPLTILRWPLPGIVLSAFVIDAVDRDVYLQFTAMTEADYQRVDKALDAYYMVFAYLAMIRNWPSGTALRVGRVLFFHRLVGTALFQLTGTRWVLVLFPNAFDFFFLFYEAMRLRWRPEHLSTRPWVGIAAALALLTVAKEAWIHLAELDVTDFGKEHLVRASPEQSWGQGVADDPWILLVGAALAFLVFLAGRDLFRWAAPDEHPGTRAGRASLDAHAELGAIESRLRGRPLTRADRPGRAVLEEALLLALGVVVFGQALELGSRVIISFVLLGTGFVMANALVLRYRRLAGDRWAAGPVELAYRLGLAVALVGSGVVGSLLAGGSPDAGAAPVFLVALAVVQTLYDRSLALHRERFGARSPSRLRP
jgi:hypothetical protein